MKPRPSPFRTRLLPTAAAGALVVSGLMLAAPTSAAQQPAAPSAADPVVGEPSGRDATGDVPEHPLAIKAKRDEQKQTALQRILQGKKPFAGAAAARERGARQAAGDENQFVPLELEGTDKVFVVIAEFGDNRHPDYCDSTEEDACANPSDGSATTYDGPAHNEIPAPDRAEDNSTLWQSDYSREHYQDMYFNRMDDYYQRQSSGRYSIDGDVTEWVKVPFNEARYGRDYCGGIVCNNTWFLLRDAMSVWTQDQLDSGKSMTEIQDYLKEFDIQDRYDADLDGNFEEPDGFIDHFQIVHAGGDQASADPIYGADAIWSHRWYANLAQGGPNGLPGFNIGSGGDDGGQTLADNPTGVWVGDYTIQPENGGLGVFVHEYGHDLGLPDLYDTSGNTGGAENSTAFWTLMSSGANIGDGGPEGIGDDPTDLGAWELFQLGWLNQQGDQGPFYDTAFAGEKSKHTLSTNTPASKDGVQALFTVLPPNEVESTLGDPATGEYMFYSTSGNDLNTWMSYDGVSGTQLTAAANFDVEQDWDYAFLEATTDGATWLPVVTNLSETDTSLDQSGINDSGTGISGSTEGEWTSLTATLPADTTGVRFRYETDGAEALAGFLVDDIAVDGTLIGGAESADEGWEFNGFTRTTGTEVTEFFNAYVAENRQYDGYDTSLETAYNFSYPNSAPDKVETYPYQDGLLISYWNDAYTDNNVGDHPGAGQVLPIDANPKLPHWADGELMRPRIASYDSTFSKGWKQGISLRREVNVDGQWLTLKGKIKGAKAKRFFDDTRTWWYGEDEHGVTGDHKGRYQPGWYSVDPPKTGTTIRVARERGGKIEVVVKPKS